MELQALKDLRAFMRSERDRLIGEAECPGCTADRQWIGSTIDMHTCKKGRGKPSQRKVGRAAQGLSKQPVKVHA